MNKKTVILGAGVSGLATAYWLKKSGADVTVLEKSSQVGGSMESISENGYLFDRGPNSGLETTEFVKELVDGVGLSDQMIYASPSGNKRYILRNNELHALPMSPPGLIKTKLFSTSAKFRLIGEMFVGRSKEGYYQSVAQFVKRRLGEEFLDYAINPFVSGVYAGRPEDLSVKSAFPKLYALEENYGGLIIGTIRSIRARKKRKEIAKQSAKMFSFKKGMQALPKAVASWLGDSVITLADVTSVSKDGERYKVVYNNAGSEKSILCDIVISTLPSFVASKLFAHMDDGLPAHLDSIYYPPVMVLYVGFKKEHIGRPLDGFGFLIPEKEEKSFLGAIWSSVLFPDRGPEDTAAFTLFIGGARNASIMNEDKDLVAERSINEFMEIMKIKEEPLYKAMRFWGKAIPQYNIGYIEHERYADEFEKKNKGIILSGNFRGGISVGDCIKNSDLVAKKAMSLIKN